MTTLIQDTCKLALQHIVLMFSSETNNSTNMEPNPKSAIWNYVFGFTPMAVVKCAIELQIPDVLESHGGAMTNAALASALRCSPSILHRIMRFLIHHGFFESRDDHCYVQTSLSRMLMKNSDNSLAALVLLESSPVMLSPWHNLSSRASENGATSSFAAAHGEDVWEFVSKDSAHSKLVNDAMACHARLAVKGIVDFYPEVFEGIGTLVDVGGGDGTALRTVVKACPWVRGVNFDLPHVISVAPPGGDGGIIEHVGGDMFESVPKADACFLMWVLHDWSDEECIQILSKCREAIPKKTGKVIIAEAVLEEEDDNYSGVRLALDMVMLAHTEKGKERSMGEWEYVVKEAGFTNYTVKKHIHDVISVIEAYP